MNTGHYISGAGHLVLIGWALFGGLFTAEPLPMQVTEVTAISSEDYAALIAPRESSDAVSEVVTPEAPAPEEETPDIATGADEAPEQAQPDAAESAPPDAAPDLSELAPLPEAELSDQPPELQEPSADTAVLMPDPDTRPQPRPIERVAPEAVAPPEPDVRIDDVEQPETTPDEAPEVPREETEQTAREEATTEIVTEADEPAQAAPSASVRPKSRPSRPQPTPEQPVQTAQPEPAQPTTDEAAVNDALAEALGQAGGTQTAAAPPPNGGLSDDQLAALIRAVGNNWAVDPGARSADAIVTVRITLDDAGNLAGTPQNITPAGANPAAQDAAFRSARTAIIAAARAGAFKVFAAVDSPVKQIEMTFNPESMRIK